MKKLSFILILLLFLISCNRKSEIQRTNATSQVTPTLKVSTIEPPTQEILPTKSFFIETISECKSIDGIFPENGWIILEATNHTGKLFLLHTNDPNLEEFGEVEPLISNSSIHASPDKKWLAYVSFISGKPDVHYINAKSFETGEIYTFEEPESLFRMLTYWINDHQVVLQKSGTPYDKITLFNPFTGEKQEMNETYPNIYLDDNGWDRIGPGLKRYDPTLSRVVYYSTDLNFIYWDIKTNKIIKEYDSDDSVILPIWAPKGNYFIFINSSHTDFINRVYKDEIMMIDWQGYEQQITHFSDHYFSHITGPFQWSPDNNYLAFYIDIKISENADFVPMLAVVNVNTGDTKLYSCISPTYSLTWSPDSHYIATNDVKNDVTSTYILRISDNGIMKVGDNMTPIEWVK